MQRMCSGSCSFVRRQVITIARPENNAKKAVRQGVNYKERI